MIQATNQDVDHVEEAKLPRRDIFILPFLSVLTIAVCLSASDLVARHYFSTGGADTCKVDDNSIGFRYRPNCTERIKIAESPWVTNQYNECGYRTKESCGPKPSGTTRIALLGSSVSLGLYVNYEQTFATQTAQELTRILHHPVEVQNLGRTNVSPISMFHQLDEALALKPDILIMAVDPYDIDHLDPADMPDRYKPIPPDSRFNADSPEYSRTLLKRIKGLVSESHLVTAMVHFLFQDSSKYLTVYLNYKDHADYLRPPLTTAWEKRLDAFDELLAEMASKSNAVHVPFVLLETPSLAQAALVKEPSPPATLAPYDFNNRLQQIAMRHGVQFVSALSEIKDGPEPNQLFYVVDTHLNAEGEALVSRVLVEQLLKKQMPALTSAQ